MTSKRILCVAALLLVPSWLSAAEPQPVTDQAAPFDDGPVFTDGRSVADGEPMFLTRGQTPSYVPSLAVRFGYWGTETDGSPTKTGEWQDLDPAPFWDVDGIFSDGRRTTDLYGTGLDREDTQMGLYHYNPRWSADVEYDRFPHHLDFDRYLNFPATQANPPADPDVPPLAVEHVDGIQDQAIRVQELDAKFKGKITENIGWRLEVWGMRKHGERQQAAMSHCYNLGGGAGRVCHISSQSQRIDWLTMEVKPVIEARFGNLTAEYSRTMRSLSTDDESLTRNYNHFFHEPWVSIGTHPFGVVPENYTQIDKLKLRYEVSDDTDVYTNMLVGDTHNKFSELSRGFHGIDARVTNRSIDGLTVVGYSKWYVENTTYPGVFNDYNYIGGLQPEDTLHRPVGYDKTSVGIKGRWRPGRKRWSSSGLSLTSGYEYAVVAREWADYYLTPNEPADVGNMPLLLAQQDTKSHIVHAGASYRWSRHLDTFLRVKTEQIEDPLLGLSERMYDLNTNQPEDINTVEVGGTWMPSENFLLSATFGTEQRHFDLLYNNPNPDIPTPSGETNPRRANFEEDNYPMTFTAWYAPTQKWSFSAGYARLTNWIDQDIRLGDAYDDGINDPVIHNEVEADPVATAWRYSGVAQVVNLGGSYAWNEYVKLRGGFEYVRGRNTFVSPSPATALDADGTVIVPDWSTLPPNAAVIVQTMKLEAGVDFWVRDNVSCYFVYNYFDYDGRSEYELLNSGTAHFFLGGVTAMF